jgi:hypothetical protein
MGFSPRFPPQGPFLVSNVQWPFHNHRMPGGRSKGRVVTLVLLPHPPGEPTTLLWTRVPLPRAALLGRLPPTNCLCLGPMTAVMTSPSAKQVRDWPGLPDVAAGAEVGMCEEGLACRCV